MRIGTTYRYARPYNSEPAEIDGLPNYFAHVPVPGPMLLLESGINAPKLTAAVDGPRRAAILISSSPHNRGQQGNPWHDEFESDEGRIIYYGDNKTGGTAADLTRGNRLLLEQFWMHSSPDADTRRRSAPIIFFERTTVEGRSKGQVRFHGFGVVTNATPITQYHPATGEYFANYRFEFCVFSLTDSGEEFNWQWVAARRDPQAAMPETVTAAPATWRKWLDGGSRVLEQCRRRVLRAPITKARAQIPGPGTRAERILNRVYERYSSRRSAFENIASYVTAHHLRFGGTRYTEGWITPVGSDHGVDFVGRIDLGSGLAGTRLVVLGQAKCEKPSQPTGGNHIARTVARLRRGWIGSYVTTSYFSEAVQQEVHEDEYPLILINGLRIVEVLELRAAQEGFATIDELLDTLDGRYAKLISSRSPDAVLHDGFLVAV